MYLFNELCVYLSHTLARVSASRYTLYVYKSSCRASRVQPVKEFASRSIEHRAEKRLNAFTVRPSREEGREGPTKKCRAAQNAYRSNAVRNVVTRSDTK